ncbi:hypothetical protein [Photorhabdus heterorhabditis]|uniref:Uncharacterized protein n=1 Tax=Photorhabdus heterorhabditis TaxID=880156 RepID=A0A5B0WDC8_9GAMM|nr:hypothetical protein [Photorhabdus heterorhabditis]KAA1184913.1 hypothetical protein F0L16_15180 [Photorhabdus heterorhabditis]
MSLETSLQQNNTLLEQQNVLLTQLVAALSNNTLTPGTKPTCTQEIEKPAITKATPVNIDTISFEIIVALAVLFKDNVHPVTEDKVSAANEVINAVGHARNGQVDALDAALQGLPEVKVLSNARLIDLCLEMLANWDDIPGITERREFALELLSEGKAHTEVGNDEEPEPVIDPKALLKEAETLILQLVKNGYRSEAVDILAKFDAKKLGQVAEKHIPEVVALAKAAMEG